MNKQTNRLINIQNKLAVAIEAGSGGTGEIAEVDKEMQN